MLFSWKTFWRLHGQKQVTRFRLFGGLREFPRQLLRAWPKLQTGGDFGAALYWGKLAVGVFVCWIFTDWFFTSYPILAIPAAFLLRWLIVYFFRKLRGAT
jgi:hypothetical protein